MTVTRSDNLSLEEQQALNQDGKEKVLSFINEAAADKDVVAMVCIAISGNGSTAKGGAALSGDLESLSLAMLHGLERLGASAREAFSDSESPGDDSVPQGDNVMIALSIIHKTLSKLQEAANATKH